MQRWVGNPVGGSWSRPRSSASGGGGGWARGRGRRAPLPWGGGGGGRRRRGGGGPRAAGGGRLFRGGGGGVVPAGGGGASRRPGLPPAPRRTLTIALLRERSISFCRLRTFFRPPACDAAKIRCRNRRTPCSTFC